ncbi:MAG: hypothetical protein AAF368_01540, partial [Planctomycetota bacterium]
MILATLLLSLGTASTVQITLPSRAEVRGTEITLGEIAVDIQTDDAVLKAQLENFDLGYAPAPGFNRLLRRERMFQSLREAFPNQPLLFEGALATRAFPMTEQIPATEIEKIARTLLDGHLKGTDYALTLTRPILNMEVPVGDQPYEIRAELADGRALPGQNAFPVRILVDGSLYQTVWTNWRVDQWREMPVLLRDVRADSELTEDLVEWRRTPVQRATASTELDRVSLANTLAIRPLKKGDVLMTTDVKRQLIVEKGDM